MLFLQRGLGTLIHGYSTASRRCLHLLPVPAQKQFISRFKIYNAPKIAKMKQREALADRKRKRTNVLSPQLRQGTSEEVLDVEVQALLDRRQAEEASSDNAQEQKCGSDEDILPSVFSEIELEVTDLSSTGDGLALASSESRVYVVPFTLPGDKVLAKVVEHHRFKPYSRTDFLKVIRPSPQRQDIGIGCKYFSKCSGCQLQMMSYADQLGHKKTVLQRAYKNFSGLKPDLVPTIRETCASPMEYEYRTKLSPHFDGPKGPKNKRKFTAVPAIGFTMKGRRRVLDVEDCPIGSPIVREGFKRERIRVAENINKYRNGATILVRESTERIPKTTTAPYATKGDTDHFNSTLVSAPLVDNPKIGRPEIRREFPTYTEIKTFTSNHVTDSVEYIDDWKFTNRAGSFFQNNNSILSKFTAYVRGHALPPALPLGSPSAKYLLDAYCGSGLFAITLSSLFKSTLGIDIDPQAVNAARANATANNVLNTGFIEADAAALFSGVPFPPSETVVVLDPPRKGCSLDFLQQLLRFNPKRIIYVSCNVHTQARDVGILVQGLGAAAAATTTTTSTQRDQGQAPSQKRREGGQVRTEDHNQKAEELEKRGKEEAEAEAEANGKFEPANSTRYEIESIRGFDFFPQTGHVEGVAFLNRV